MSGESFRFLHAGDFHLEKPLGDVDGLPASMRPAAISAPRDAAAAVFEAATAANIDFVVLSGDLLSPSAAGPHGMSLVLDGLERLHQLDKPVFWATGIQDDSAKWPEAVPLPPNVRLFAKTDAESFPVVRSGRTIATVSGRSSDGQTSLRPSSISVEPTDHFAVAVGYGTVDAAALQSTRFDHWCLGGRAAAETLDIAGESTAAYCGSPQSRGFADGGPHGYTIVDVDADRTRRVTEIACDTFRYADCHLHAAEVASVGSLKNLLSRRLNAAQNEADGRHLILRFNVQIDAGEDLSLVTAIESTLQSLRRDHGGGNPATWTAAIDVTPPRAYPSSWRDEDTILGDFLRVAAGATTPDLAAVAESHPLPANVAGRLTTPTGDYTADAALMGVRLLRGESAA